MGQYRLLEGGVWPVLCGAEMVNAIVVVASGGGEVKNHGGSCDDLVIELA